MSQFPTILRKTWNQTCGFTPGTVLPPECSPQVPAVLVVAFYGSDMVLADIKGRGLTVPSGHIESGETPDDAAVRETYEETGGRIADGSLRHVGFHMFTMLNGPRTGQMRACPVYVAEIAGFEAIPAGSESLGIKLVAPETIAEHYFIWDELTEAFFNFTLAERSVTVNDGIE